MEAQTLANVYLALENDLEILPVLNKIDLPAAEPERVRDEIEQVGFGFRVRLGWWVDGGYWGLGFRFGCGSEHQECLTERTNTSTPHQQTVGLDCSEVVLASAKSGIGIEDILEQIVAKVPPPVRTQINHSRYNYFVQEGRGRGLGIIHPNTYLTCMQRPRRHAQAPPTGGPLKALIFDSYYDAYRGVVVYFRVMDGEIRPKVRPSTVEGWMCGRARLFLSPVVSVTWPFELTRPTATTDTQNGRTRSSSWRRGRSTRWWRWAS